ncbi:MAG: hypothetical protein P8011_16245 [Acidihalobacter sp.]|uniref:hypothetical protein n=1 Tax=Acidihalobacter sp. TaxID=1872108 RepID=UPI00307DBC0C
MTDKALALAIAPPGDEDNQFRRMPISDTAIPLALNPVARCHDNGNPHASIIVL